MICGPQPQEYAGYRSHLDRISDIDVAHTRPGYAVVYWTRQGNKSSVAWFRLCNGAEDFSAAWNDWLGATYSTIWGRPPQRKAAS